MTPTPRDETLPLDGDFTDELRKLVGDATSIVQRRPSSYSSTFATEVVTIGRPGMVLDLFCKHGQGYVSPVSEHRRGVPYEAAVYERVVAATEAPSVRFVGCIIRPESSTLVIEMLHEALRVHKVPAAATASMLEVANELGRWHRRGEGHLEGDGMGLNRFDVAHLERWTTMAVSALDGRTDEPSRRLVEVISSPMADALLETETTLIHGELFTSNVLVTTDGSVRFVDWESAGTGPGSLDLAFLIAGSWSEATRDSCVAAYVAGRYGGREPAGFRRSLAAAEIYVLHEILRHARRRDPDGAAPSWILPQVEEAGRRLGVRS